MPAPISLLVLPACARRGLVLALLVGGLLGAAFSGGAPALAGPPDGEKPGEGAAGAQVLRAVLVDLASRDHEVRRAALGQLSSLLAVDPEAGPAALPRLKLLLRAKDPTLRARVLPLLLRIPRPEARAHWLATLDPEEEAHEEVLAAATRATRQVPADAALVRLLTQAYRVASGAPARRALLLEALGWMEGPLVDLLLSRPGADEHWVEASARALALGRRREVASLEPLFALLGHAELAPRVHAWEALVALTGQDLPVEAEAWRSWWARQEQDRLPPRPRLKAGGGPAGAGEKTRYAAATPVHVPHYYDIPIPRPASRVVFCLDASQSMYGDGIDQARRELRRTIMDLPSTHAFEVIVFNEKLLPWARRLAAAHPVQKFLAIAALDAIEPTSYTNIYDAVELAFGHAGRGPRAVPGARPLDAVFLLSDGAPNRGRYRTDKAVLTHIAALSARQIPVHTIGAGEEVFPLLRAIAHETGGRFVDAFE